MVLYFSLVYRKNHFRYTDFMIKATSGVDFSNTTINPAARVNNFSTLVGLIGPIAMIAGGLIFLSMLLWGAFLYITSGGEQEKVQQGKRTLTFAFIGLIIMICATLFVNLISYFLGVKSFFAQ